MSAKTSVVRTWTRTQSRLGRAAARPVVVLGLLGTAAALLQVWTIARLLAAGLGVRLDHPVRLLLAFGGLSLLRALLQGLGDAAAERLGRTARRRLRREVLQRIMQSGPAVLGRMPTGAMTALVVDRIEALDGFFSRYLPAGLIAVAGPALVLVAAFLAQPFAGFVLLGCGATVPALQAVFGIGAAAATRRQFAALSRLQGRFVDRMRGIATLVLAGRSADEAARLGRDAAELRVRTMRVLRVAFLSSASLDFAAAAAILMIALHDGGSLFRHAGGGAAAPLSVTHALFALLLVPEFFAPLRTFSLAYQDRMQATACGEALHELPTVAAVTASDVAASRQKTAGPVGLVFEEVRFAWDETRGRVLDRLSFSLAPGETVVLVGASGSGKSTIMELVLGFIRPDSGRILIGCEDLQGLERRRLSGLVSWIGQRPMLFAGSLRDNLLFSRPEATEAELQAAVEAAALLPVIDGLPQGLETIVGDGGYGLSGGERQRVAIARAVLRDAPLLLLDEPTAHLDPETERSILETLRGLAAQRSVLMSSHSEQVQGEIASLSGRRLHLVDGRLAVPPPLAPGSLPLPAGSAA